MSYWETVKACLMEFHRFLEPQADSAVVLYEKDVVLRLSNPMLIYHEEPFYLANEIADEEIPLEKYRTEYDSVVNKFIR